MQTDEMRKELERIFEEFPEIRAADIPGIDLYMDQVTTFLQDNLRGLSRDPDGDKFLTKTMINNYVKNKVLFPPVKKKYSREHMMLLIMIYYMKSFLSIGDIRGVTAPLMERFAQPSPEAKAERKAARPQKDREDRDGISITGIYESVTRDIMSSLPSIREDILREIDEAEGSFPDVPAQDRAALQRFSLISRLSAEVFVRKLFIEKLLDME